MLFSRLIREVPPVADDLNAPLGQDRKAGRKWAVPVFIPQALTGLLGLSLVVFVLWTATTQDPWGGEPSATVMVEPGPAAAKMAAGADQPIKVETSPAIDGPAAGSKTITIIDGSSGKREEVTIPATPAAATESAPASPNPRLLETSRHGAIPKIGPDGARPAEVYARPVKLAAGKAEGPRIAIVVSGLGTGTSGTADALAKLPAAVTFAFTPYSVTVDQL